MDFDTLSAKRRLKIKVSRRDESDEPFAENVLLGLSANSKWLSPKFLYDKEGSQLFEKICSLPEYYPTRTERAIIAQNAERIVRATEQSIELVELGSGSSVKTKLLIEAFLQRESELHYIAIDISKSMLVKSARQLLKNYDALKITALVSDYKTALKALAKRKCHPKLIMFLGSSIGNFDQKDAEAFLLQVRQSMGPQDRFLIGMDLVKPTEILLAAYNDAQGVTSRFNLNLLARINRELDGEFDLRQFYHHVEYNKIANCIQLYQVSKCDQKVFIKKLHRVISLKKSERIHTENSHKYSKNVIQAMARRNGFWLEHAWYDDKEWFSLNMMRPI